MDDIGMPEGAVDQGGPKREFFTLALKELHDSDMFSGPPAKKFIVPSHTGEILLNVNDFEYNMQMPFPLCHGNLVVISQ